MQTSRFFSIENDLWPIKVLHCGNREFRVLAAVTLTLTRWPSYTHVARIPWSCTCRPKCTFYGKAF